MRIRFLTIVLTLGLVCWGSLLARGDCYYPTYTRTEYVYRELPVAYPVPFTVAVPVISYLANGPAFTPVFQAQPANAMAPVQTAQPKATAPQAGSGLNLTDEQLDMLISRIETRLKARAPAPTASEPRDTPPPAVPSSDDVVSILTKPHGAKNQACADCHTGKGAKGGVEIFSAPGVLNPKAPWFDIWDAADEGRMPPEAKTNKAAVLSDQDVERLRQKVRDGRSTRK